MILQVSIPNFLTSLRAIKKLFKRNVEVQFAPGKGIAEGIYKKEEDISPPPPPAILPKAEFDDFAPSLGPTEAFLLRKSTPIPENAGLVTPSTNFQIPDYSRSKKVTITPPIGYGSKTTFNTSTNSEITFGSKCTVTEKGEFKLSSTPTYGHYSINVEYNDKVCTYDFYAEPDLKTKNLTISPGSSDVIPQLDKTTFYLVKGPRDKNYIPQHVEPAGYYHLNDFTLFSRGTFNAYPKADLGDYILVTAGGQIITISVKNPASIPPEPASTPDKVITANTTHQFRIPPPQGPEVTKRAEIAIGKLPIEKGSPFTVQGPTRSGGRGFGGWTFNGKSTCILNGDLLLDSSGTLKVTPYTIPYTYKITVNQKDTYILEIKR